MCPLINRSRARRDRTPTRHCMHTQRPRPEISGYSAGTRESRGRPLVAFHHPPSCSTPPSQSPRPRPLQTSARRRACLARPTVTSEAGISSLGPRARPPTKTNLETRRTHPGNRSYTSSQTSAQAWRRLRGGPRRLAAGRTRPVPGSMRSQ